MIDFEAIHNDVLRRSIAERIRDVGWLLTDEDIAAEYASAGASLEMVRHERRAREATLITSEIIDLARQTIAETGETPSRARMRRTILEALHLLRAVRSGALAPAHRLCDSPAVEPVSAPRMGGDWPGRLGTVAPPGERSLSAEDR